MAFFDGLCLDSVSIELDDESLLVFKVILSHNLTICSDLSHLCLFFVYSKRGGRLPQQQPPDDEEDKPLRGRPRGSSSSTSRQNEKDHKI